MKIEEQNVSLDVPQLTVPTVQGMLDSFEFDAFRHRQCSMLWIVIGGSFENESDNEAMDRKKRFCDAAHKLKPQEQGFKGGAGIWRGDELGRCPGGRMKIGPTGEEKLEPEGV